MSLKNVFFALNLPNMLKPPLLIDLHLIVLTVRFALWISVRDRLLLEWPWHLFLDQFPLLNWINFVRICILNGVWGQIWLLKFEWGTTCLMLNSWWDGGPWDFLTVIFFLRPDFKVACRLLFDKRILLHKRSLLLRSQVHVLNCRW